jgi:TRAP-type C4-dicarboxylate transport system permease small subunit
MRKDQLLNRLRSRKALVKSISGGGIIIYTIMVSLVVVQVFLRYVLNYPLMWIDSTACYLFIWLVFIGSAQAFFQEGHVKLEFLIQRFPEKLKKWINISTHLILMGLSVYILTIIGIKMTLFAFRQVSPGIQWLRMGWIYIAIPIGGFLMTIAIFQDFLELCSRCHPSDKTGSETSGH